MSKSVYGRGWVGLSCGLVVLACGGEMTTRTVDAPMGSSISYGAPRDTGYTVEVEPAKSAVRVHVYEHSRCDVIPVRLVHRTRETLRGDEVVQTEDLGKKQVASRPTGETKCNQTYARNVEVALVVGDAVYPVGMTDAEGTVEADLTQVFQSSAYADAPPAEAIVRIRPDQAAPALDGAKVSLAELGEHEQRVTELLGELEAILAKGETGASGADITRSYELVAQLHDIAFDDPRVRAASARFWELFYGRKQEEARQKMEKNLDALARAKDVLAAAGDAAIPIYVQAAVNSGYEDARAVEWSTIRLIRALRQNTVLCTDTTWRAMNGLPADARVASGYLQYVQGSQYATHVTRICQQF